MGFTAVLNLFQGRYNDLPVFRRTILHPKAVGTHGSGEQVLFPP